MADREQIKRILRRVIPPGTGTPQLEQQLDEIARRLLEMPPPAAEQLEALSAEVTGRAETLRGVDLKVLTLVLQELRGERAFKKSREAARRR